MVAVKPTATPDRLARCSNSGMSETPQDRVLERLRALCDRHGLDAVSVKSGVSREYLRQLVRAYPLESGNPRSLGRKSAARLTQAYPDWMEPQHLPEGETRPRGQEAQILSQHSASYSPQFTWEALMTQQAMPQHFRVAMPDDSMSPRVRRGDVIEFDATLTPRSGDGVLVRTAAGALFFRLYRQGLPGAWEAHPVNPDFLPLHSARDELSVVAVMVGLPVHRWG